MDKLPNAPFASGLSVASLSMASGTVFDVDSACLKNMAAHAQHSGAERKELLVTNNGTVLLKFCDVCKKLNVDPLHPESLPVVVIYMSKSKHCVEIVQQYVRQQECAAMLESIDLDREDMRTSCEVLLCSMGDWLTLFSYLLLFNEPDALASPLDAPGDSSRKTAAAAADKTSADKTLAEKTSAEKTSERERHQRLLVELEHNNVVKRMMASLAESQVVAAGSLPQHSRTPLQTALLALLFLSPRCTPAGKMLERLYTDINDNARDAELRCLRAMTSFKDTMDDERASAATMPLVMRCFRVAPEFARSIAAVLRKQLAECEQVRQHSQVAKRALLRDYALRAVEQRSVLVGQDSFTRWRNHVAFPNSTSSHMQRLLYFICAQERACSGDVYARLYTKDLIKRSHELKIDVIDMKAMKMVLDSLRLYMNNVKQLIDFSQKCLQGINQEKRQKLSLVQVLQLYIACHQHESIWKECWKHVVPVLNHTICSDCAEFRKTHEYDVGAVVENLLRSLVD